MATIIVTHENNEMDEFDFDVEIKTITIGRRSTNDVCVPHLSVSGTHCKITISDDGSMIEDQNSTNGTYINGRLISRQLLNDGDDIVIGKARLTFLQPETVYSGGAAKSAGDKVFAGLEEGSSNSARGGDRTHNKTQGRIIDAQPVSETSGASATKPATKPAAVAAEYYDGDDGEQLSLAEKAALNMRGQTADSVGDSGKSEFAGDYYEPDENEIKAMISDAPAAESAPDASVATDHSRSAQAAAGVAAATAGVAAVASGVAGSDESALAQSSDEVSHVLEDYESPDASGAVIEIKNGAKSGQVLPIDKPVTTLGRPGIQIAAIMKKPEGYFLMHIESENTDDRPKLNNNMIGDDPVMLNSGDSLKVAGIDVEFMLS